MTTDSRRMVSLLRRYVIQRSRGERAPEFARLVDLDGTGAWLYADERAARASNRWRRLHVPGRPWCPVLGRHVEVAHDTELQSYFVTVTEGEWQLMELDVRRRPTCCLEEWRAAGRRLIDAARAASAAHRLPGKLSGWPKARGTGPNSMKTARTKQGRRA